MNIISSKIRFNKNDLAHLYEVLLDGQWIHDTNGQWLETPQDLKLIHITLTQKIADKIKREKANYILDLNVFEIFYIQIILQSLIPYLGLRTAEYQNNIFENRYEYNSYQIKQLKDIHSRIFDIYKSLCNLMESIQSLAPYYTDHFREIMDMSLEERMTYYLQINEQIHLEDENTDNIIPIHRQS